MNQIFRTLLFLSVLTICVSGRAEDHYVVLIGVETYDTSTFKNLEFAGDDAIAMGAQFQRLGFKTTVMTSESKSARLRPTTPKKIIDAIQAVGRSCAPEDTLVIGLSGHGVQFSDEGLLPSGVRETYFCPSDADLKDKTSLLKISTIVDTLNQTKAMKKLLLIDACQENVLSAEGQTKGSKLIDVGSVHETRKTIPGGIAILFSCSDKQFSWEHRQLKHSVFSYHVIEYLRGSAQARYYDEGKMELSGLVSYVAKNTNDYVIQNNLTPDGQYPVLRGNTTNWTLGTLQGEPNPKNTQKEMNKAGVIAKSPNEVEDNAEEDTDVPKNNLTPKQLDIIGKIPKEFRSYLVMHPVWFTAEATADIVYDPKTDRWLIIAVASSPEDVKNPKIVCKLKAINAVAELKPDALSIETVTKLGATGASQEIETRLKARANGIPLLSEWKSDDGKTVSLLFGSFVDKP